ncbi:unnamed protein product [Paramecium pentaurelia]|uniref:Uncharacterized protein n=1 Tax=Paramecium pentaurelia TaxID=43138 RepID=A0A8S1UBQ8_9CILI|nr:unnamed protein product [Paramecium pentaurelia]
MYQAYFLGHMNALKAIKGRKNQKIQESKVLVKLSQSMKLYKQRVNHFEQIQYKQQLAISNQKIKQTIEKIHQSSPSIDRTSVSLPRLKKRNQEGDEIKKENARIKLKLENLKGSISNRQSKYEKPKRYEDVLQEYFKQKLQQQ